MNSPVEWPRMGLGRTSLIERNRASRAEERARGETRALDGRVAGGDLAVTSAENVCWPSVSIEFFARANGWRGVYFSVNSPYGYILDTFM